MASLFAKFNKLCLLNFIVFLYFLCLTATISATTTATSTASAMTKPRRFVIKLIHPDSTLSPTYNPNATIKDRAKRALKSSMARLAYLHAKTGFVTDSISIGAGLLPEDNLGGFAANISIGEPPVPQLLSIDTGSNLLWLQCLPCTKCFEQKGPIFDPSKSSTYTTLQCTSPSCSISPSDKCDPSNNCKFSLGYRDDTRAAGLLATEKLTLETSDEGISPVSDVVFGCAHDSIYDNKHASGILGLGPSDISLTTHLGSKFSYCIGRIRDPTYPHNQLVLGDGAKIEGTSTLLQTYNNLYYVRPESISLAERRLVIDPEVFKRPLAGPGGTIIDSGTTFTFLVKSAYDVVIAEVQKLFDGKLEKVQVPDFPLLLCYKGVISHDLIGFPILVINFADGADLGLNTESLFLQVSDKEFCMAVQEDDEFNIIGIMAQQGYNVAYDVAGFQLYFQSIDCALLDD